MYRFWEKKKFPYIKPVMPFGNVPFTLKRSNAGVHLQTVYTILLNNNLKYSGVYMLHLPRILLTCPKLIENVLQKDFNYFTDRGFYFNEIHDPLSANLFALDGEKWRRVRNKLSSSFTLSKLKVMLPHLRKCGYDLTSAIYSKCKNDGVIDIKDMAMSHNINVIASCGFGLECNCFVDNLEFKRQGKKIFDLSSRLRWLKLLFAFTYMNAARNLGVTLFDRDTTAFFTNILKETIKFRRENNITRHDMINSIIELGNNFDDNEIKQLAAHVFIFFAAGYETTSITLTFCLYELSINNNLQNKLRQEIDQVLEKHNGEVNYEALMDMKYMDQIVNETLRKYPPLLYITRVCGKNYPLPNTIDIIPKGENVDISILGLHHNPEYYPDPNKFDPERFSPCNRHKISSTTYMPFGAGPRKCIGMQFGLVNLKLSLTMLLHRFSFTLNKITKEPLAYDEFSFTLVPKHEIFLDTKLRSHNFEK
ncbi:hypothetical protein FQR65_LT07880 [Abscondita terminalis]|nr:hypothetical protein FQR65_LT07880 [Abscondita terminalis]